MLADPLASPFTFAVIPLLYLAAVTPALVAIDVRQHRLPNALVLPGYPVAALGLVGEWIRTGQPPAVALVAGAASIVFLLALSLGGGMGMGDVKLAGVLGLAAGLVGVTPAVVSPLAAFTLGGVAALVVAARRGRGARIPFGPFLLAGFWIAVVLELVSS
jgi:leader peptidase (prepilin peptidase)/N-methyltransferase